MSTSNQIQQNSKLDAIKRYILVLSVSALRVDKYQRPLRLSRVKKYIKEFDIVKTGVILVSKRADGTYWIIDGQHRYFAMKNLGFQSITCLIHEGLTYKQEAETFYYVNDIKVVSPLEKLNSRIEMEDGPSINLVAICLKHGFIIDTRSPRKEFRSIRVLQDIYTYDNGVALDRILKVINTAYPTEKSRTLNKVLRGMFIFLKKYGDAVDEKNLIKRLSSAGIVQLFAKGNSFMQFRMGQEHDGIAEAITDIYDYKRVGNKRLRAKE
jgi:hypothetical protein